MPGSGSRQILDAVHSENHAALRRYPEATRRVTRHLRCMLAVCCYYWTDLPGDDGLAIAQEFAQCVLQLGDWRTTLHGVKSWPPCTGTGTGTAGYDFAHSRLVTMDRALAKMKVDRDIKNSASQWSMFDAAAKGLFLWYHNVLEDMRKQGETLVATTAMKEGPQKAQRWQLKGGLVATVAGALRSFSFVDQRPPSMIDRSMIMAT